MAELFSNLRGLTKLGELSPHIARESAVSAALVLIHAKVGNTPERAAILKEEMANLSDYADKIQEALKVK